LGVALMAGSGVTTSESDWNMDSVLFAHSVGGVPACTVVIFGGKLLVILNVDGRVTAETRFYTAAPTVTSHCEPMTKPFDH